MCATSEVCSPPPCGEGLGVGVVVVDASRAATTTPLPNPPPQGGRERTERVARVCLHFTGTTHTPAITPVLSPKLFVSRPALFSSVRCRLEIVVRSGSSICRPPL